MESLSLSTHAESDDFATPTRLRNATTTARARSAADTELEQQGENSTSSRAHRDRLRTLYRRSASSPSPARRSPHRLYTARKLSARRKRKAKNDSKALAGAVGTDKGLFYDYLFA